MEMKISKYGKQNSEAICYKEYKYFSLTLTVEF